MTTLRDLHALLDLALTHPDNPALLRLPVEQRTVEGLARAYLPAWIAHVDAPDFGNPMSGIGAITWGAGPQGVGYPRLDLTDPGTARALLVALALALGLDPGPLALGVLWCRSRGDDGWELHALDGWLCIVSGATVTPSVGSARRIEWSAPAIVAEPNDARALSLAAVHLLAR